MRSKDIQAVAEHLDRFGIPYSQGTQTTTTRGQGESVHPILVVQAAHTGPVQGWTDSTLTYVFSPDGTFDHMELDASE